MTTTYAKQHELGLAGLALLRNWVIGDRITTTSILGEITDLVKDPSIFPSENVNKYDVRVGYQTWAATYDSMPNLLIDIEEPVVKSLLQQFSPGKALDAACGTGRYSDFLYSLGHSVTGVDLSSAMLRKAKKRNKKIKFLEGDLTALPLKNSSIDLAICALALTHFKDMNKAITELRRVVRKQGHIIISDIHPWLVSIGGQADFHDKTGKWGYVPNYVQFPSIYLQIFNRLGLKVIQCVEPTLESSHVELARTGLNLSSQTAIAALYGLPVALVWVLERT